MTGRRQLLQQLAALPLLPLLGPAAAGAAPRRYRLEGAAPAAGFVFFLNGAAQNGSIPVTRARISLDPAQLDQTSAEAVLNARKARASLPIATAALRSPGVLDAARHPRISFRSTRVRLGAAGRLSQGAQMEGELTLRGVTRPLVLSAELFRLPGTDADDLRVLDVRLSGSLNRFDFGASGYPGLVGARVDLDIRARISAA